MITCSAPIFKAIILAGSLILNNNIDIINNNLKEYNKVIISEMRRIEVKKIYSNVPMNPDHIVHVINLCYQYGIDPDLVLAIIWNESNFNPNAKNKYSSARGYGQFIKSTANSLAKEINIKNYNHNIQGYDPYINIHMMVLYLSNLIDRYNGNVHKALLSYRGMNDKKYFNNIYKRMKIIKDKKIKL